MENDITYAQWRTAGERTPVGPHRVFVLEAGRGRHLTLLHGFPTCSWDWSRVWPALAAERRLLAMDLLGFGDSDKPAMRYTFEDHADRLEAVWSARNVTRTTLVAHDYSVTLALELMARRREAPETGARIEQVVLLNGAVRGALHRARPIQRILRSPLGPLVARLMSRGQFERSLSRVFVHPPDRPTIDAFWASINQRGGRARVPSLLHYIPDRVQHAERWEGALEHSATPLSFIWGVRDPVSGAHVLETIDPAAARFTLPVGHYPHWEAPSDVARALLESTA